MWGQWYKDELFIFAFQARQVFFTRDPLKGGSWQIVEKFSHRHLWDIPVQEDDVENDDNAIEDNSSSMPIAINEHDMEALLIHHDDMDPEICTTVIQTEVRPPIDDDNANIDYDG